MCLFTQNCGPKNVEREIHNKSIKLLSKKMKQNYNKNFFRIICVQ